MLFLTILAAAQERLIQLDVATAQVVLGLIIPLIVATVMKSKASSMAKALANALLVAVSGGLSLIVLNSGSMPLNEFISAVAIAFVVSGAAYQHLWKPLGWAEAIQAYFPGGVGKNVIETTGNETSRTFHPKE